MLLPIHIAAGGLTIVLGAVALVVKKGGSIHRRSGLLFVYAMLVMGACASILGLRKGGLTDGNVMGGLLTLYFVGTAHSISCTAASGTRCDKAARFTPVPGLVENLAVIAMLMGGLVWGAGPTRSATRQRRW